MDALRTPEIVYTIAIKVQVMYQFCYLFFLLGRGEKDAISFTIISAALAFLVSLSYIFFKKNAEKLFHPYTIFSQYKKIIFMDYFIALIAFSGYFAVLKDIKSKYENNKEKLYYLHLCKEYLDLEEESITEPIETTTKFLVEQAKNLRDSVISFVGNEENISEPIDLSRFKYNETTPTSVQDLSQSFEHFYNQYINLELTIPSAICILIHFFVVGILTWIEHIKYKFRQIQQLQQAQAMAVMGNVVVGENGVGPMINPVANEQL